MKLSDAYPSAFLKAEDLDGQDLTFTIASVELETLGQGKDAEQKLVIGLRGHSKKFVCNKTNATQIGKQHGDDTDDWLGKNITLGPREVQFGNEMVWSIRVCGRPPVRTGATPVRQVAQDPSDYADEQMGVRGANRATPLPPEQ